jgi:hypothetical protein
MTEPEPQVTTVFGVTHRDGDRQLGPIHAMTSTYGQAWCGVKAQYRHRVRPGTRGNVDCSRCLKALNSGTPFAWKSR